MVSYQRAFIDFFEDQLVQEGYDWRALVDEFLYEGKEPLINNIICGRKRCPLLSPYKQTTDVPVSVAHGLIHMGYAFELSSRTLAIEALTLVTCFYDRMHIYLDDPSYTKPAPWTSTSPLEILEKLAKDSRLYSMFSSPGDHNMAPLLEDKKKEEIMLEYWNSLSVRDPKAQFEAGQAAATAILVGSHESGEQYDFFLCHLLTSSHAVRIMLPYIPAKYHIPLVRQWWLFVVVAYIMQLRPAIDTKKIEEVDVAGKTWKVVDDRAVNGRHATDAHYVKGEF